MSDGWLNPSKYEHIPITGCTGPGTMRDGYAWKWVNHTTESPAGSIDGVIALFKSQPCYCPHFCIDPLGSGRRVQFIPWGWSAAALRGGAQGYETNRGRSVQVEIVGRAAETQGWPDDALWQVADLIADCIIDGVPINLDNVPDDASLSGTLATMDAPQRMGWEQWKLFDGVTAHVRVPNNDHWDAGRLDGRKVAAFAKQILAGVGRTVVPRPPTQPLPPAPTAPQVGYISKGMTGGIVKFAQDLLVGLGYNCGGADGIFGFQTEQAVIQFQKDKGLVADGVIGPQTNAAISAAYAAVATKPVPPPPPVPADGFPAWPGRFLLLCTPMMNGGDVRTWQTQMAARGWAITADGWFGEGSRSTAKSFQADKGLVVDGVVGRQTWAAAWTSSIT